MHEFFCCCFLFRFYDWKNICHTVNALFLFEHATYRCTLDDWSNFLANIPAFIGFKIAERIVLQIELLACFHQVGYTEFWPKLSVITIWKHLFQEKIGLSNFSQRILNIQTSKSQSCWYGLFWRDLSSPIYSRQFG